MKRLGFSQFIIAFVLLTVFSQNSAAEQKKPNIVFILADDVTYNTLGCYGGKDAKTPNIDRLVGEGMRFTKAYSAMAMCAPFRAELYTGLYPVRNGVAWNHARANSGTKSVCQYLAKEGYRVGLSGKKHAAPASTFAFKKVDGFPAGDGVRQFMTKDKRQPFCLFLCSNNAHAPWTSGDASKFDQGKIALAPIQHDNPKTRGIMARYLAEVVDLDREVGEILALIEESGERENTIVMFSSEQGWALGFAKWSNWDLGVRTGFMARWPGRIKAGSASDALIQMADVLPTMLEAAGAEVEPGNFDGRSFYRHLLGQKQAQREYVYGIHNNVPEGNPYPIRSIRDKDYHYILNLKPEVPYHEKHVMAKNSRLGWWEALKEAEAKDNEDAIALVKRFQTRLAEGLYKVDEDLYETTNLAGSPEYAEVKARLHAELKRWMNEQKDPGEAMDTPAAFKANGKRKK